MTSIARLGFIVVLTIVSVLSLTRSSDAQSGSFSSSGFESFSNYEYTGNGPVLVSSGANIPATFGFSYFALDPYGDYYVSMSIYSNTWAVSLSGTIYDSPVPYPSASFFIGEQNFEGVGNYFTDGVNTVGSINESSNEGFSLTTFQTVPEPASIVQGALALIVIGIIASVRGLRPRFWPKLS